MGKKKEWVPIDMEIHCCVQHPFPHSLVVVVVVVGDWDGDSSLCIQLEPSLRSQEPTGAPWDKERRRRCQSRGIKT